LEAEKENPPAPAFVTLTDAEPTAVAVIPGNPVVVIAATKPVTAALSEGDGPCVNEIGWLFNTIVNTLLGTSADALGAKLISFVMPNSWLPTLTFSGLGLCENTAEAAL
jgi:hypothetical protein